MPEAAGLYYEQHGPPDAPALILSSGLGGSASYWSPNLAALAETRRVIAYDHRGSGRSGRMARDAETIGAMGRDVIALMDALDLPRADLVGHALGGIIGLDVALTADRLDKVVVVNGWGRLDPHTARCFDIRLDILRSSGPAAYQRAQPIFLYPATWISVHHDRLEDEARRGRDHFPPVDHLERRVAALRDWCLPDSYVQRAAVLVIGTADDMLVPAAASRALADSLTGGLYREIPWGGHACNVTNPEAFQAILQTFLGS